MNILFMMKGALTFVRFYPKILIGPYGATGVKSGYPFYDL